VHDFVLAGQYLVFHSSSTDESLLVLSGLSSFSDALEWKPSKGTQFLVVDRETLSLVAVKQNLGISGILLAVDASGAVIVDVVRYEDFQTNVSQGSGVWSNPHSC